jgi:hypothetical protein
VVSYKDLYFFSYTIALWITIYVDAGIEVGFVDVGTMVLEMWAFGLGEFVVELYAVMSRRRML